jgi:hypothetical protein
MQSDSIKQDEISIDPEESAGLVDLLQQLKSDGRKGEQLESLNSAVKK